MSRLVTARCLEILNLPHNTLSVDDFAENNMLLVQMWRWHSGDEELASVGARSGVGHGEEEWLLMQFLEVFVLELLAIDALAACAIALGEVSTLDHERPDYAVEG